MVFSYDEDNTPIGYQLKGTSGVWYYYYYAKNIQGDIVALYRYDKDSDGNKVATHIANYEYDPWGKVLSITNASGADLSGYSSNAAVLNPLRYRGYYYDSESGFYYLQSRYYDPSIGRFINADQYAGTGKEFLGYNMFAYCNNNPICKYDSGGVAPVDLWDVDGDGEIDCYVYEYTYEIAALYFFSIPIGSRTETGTVYIYKNVSVDFFENTSNIPEGFVDGRDLMVGDFTYLQDPNLYAYRAGVFPGYLHSGIVDVLLEYGQDYAPDWKRTRDSLLTEWESHCLFAPFSKRAMNVDFNNKEEGKGYSYFVGKAIKAVIS